MRQETQLNWNVNAGNNQNCISLRLAYSNGIPFMQEDVRANLEWQVDATIITTKLNHNKN